MLLGLLGPELEPEIGTELGPQSEAPRRVRVPVLVRPIDDELLLPCPQSCGPLKHRLRQVDSTAKRAVMAEPEVQALLVGVVGPSRQRKWLLIFPCWSCVAVLAFLTVLSCTHLSE